MRLGIVTCLLPALLIAQPGQCNEADVRKQNAFCEAATRLPWGDVDRFAWEDCMIHREVRPIEERRVGTSLPRTSWYRAYQDSSLNATAEGCETWASRQPADPPRMRRDGVWYANHSWNLCMERQRVFAPAQGRSPVEGRPVDFKLMAVQQRTTDVINEGFGCQDRARYLKLDTEFAELVMSEILGKRPKFKDLAEINQEKRKALSVHADCRWWASGERVQVKAADEPVLCLSPAGSAAQCYWSDRSLIDAWQ